MNFPLAVWHSICLTGCSGKDGIKFTLCRHITGHYNSIKLAFAKSQKKPELLLL